MTDTIQQFDYDVNVLKAILWQYNNAPNILSLLNKKQAWYDTNEVGFWEDFRANIFDLKTANDFGLSVWSIILGAPIIYNLPGAGTKGWGFGQYRFNFTNGNFASNTGVVYSLSTETARVILRLRYYQLTGTCTVPAINRMLADVFKGYGQVYIEDGLDMTQRYVFGFALPSDMQFAFTNFDVLPRPAGVGNTFTVFIEAPWGFNSDASNFDNSNFSDE